MTEEQMRYLTEDPLPEGFYSSAEAAIIRYAQKSTRLEPIDDATYGNLARHFSKEQIMHSIEMKLKCSHMLRIPVVETVLRLDTESFVAARANYSGRSHFDMSNNYLNLYREFIMSIENIYKISLYKGRASKAPGGRSIITFL